MKSYYVYELHFNEFLDKLKYQFLEQWKYPDKENL